MTRKFTLAAFLSLALGAAATVPFKVTTVTDGQFAPGTKWYTMKIHNAGFIIHTADDNSSLRLDRTTSQGLDADLWCFVGNDTDGYTVYNKAVGAGQALCAPSDPASDGNTGGNSHVAVKAPGAEGYSYVWDFTDSPDITNSQYMSIHGSTTATVNKRGDILAFWTSGKDAGSSIVISLVTDEVDATVNGSSVVLPNGATLSCPGGTATLTDGVLSLGEGNWTLAPSDGNWLLSYSCKTTDGRINSADDLFYTKETPVIAGPVELVRLEAVQAPVTANGYPIFMTHNSAGYNVAYRIPSIVTVMAGPHAGRLYAVNDYRYSGADIGSGRIDLYQVYSDDNGKTWTKPHVMVNAQGTPVAQGTGAGGNVITNLDCGFGDPATVSDRETGELFMVACCGRMPFFSSRRDNPQPSARWWSTDGGETWTEPDYTQWEQIYALFDDTCPHGYIDGQFIGSGRMIQSKYIKVGSHYRIYAVMSGRNVAAGNISNWVLYSDDFGHNWKILGGGMKPGVPSNGDEPKAEELPDGSVLLAARGNGGNRNFNIFRYTDVEKGEGNWASAINTDLGIGSTINACNGEIMILPARNKETGEKCYIALQSYPAGPDRKNVSIAWKVLASGADFDSPEDFRHWNGHFLVAPDMNSLYSTMTFQADNKIGFLYEEDTYRAGIGGYNEIYRALTIDEITGNKYEYCADEDEAVRQGLTSSVLGAILESMAPGKYVGQPVTGPSDVAKAIAAGYAANPSYQTVVDFNNAILDVEVIKVVDGNNYRFISPNDGTYSNQQTDRYLAANVSSLATTTKANTTTTVFTVNELDGAGSAQFRLYNAQRDRYVGATAASHSQKVPMVKGTENAAPFTFVSDIYGHTSITCATPGTAGYPGIHMNSGFAICNWTADAGKSLWYMEPVADDPEGAITEIGTDSAAPSRIFDLQGREVTAPRRGQVYITDDHRKIRL